MHNDIVAPTSRENWAQKLKDYIRKRKASSGIIPSGMMTNFEAEHKRALRREAVQRSREVTLR